jgi:hypothetical protein
MPTESFFPDVTIPDVDLWGLIFDRKDRGFSDDKGMVSVGTRALAHTNMDSVIPYGEFEQEVHFR